MLAKVNLKYDGIYLKAAKLFSLVNTETSLHNGLLKVFIPTVDPTVGTLLDR